MLRASYHFYSLLFNTIPLTRLKTRSFTIIIWVKDKYKMADLKNSQFRIPPQMQQLGPAIENLDSKHLIQ